MQMLAELCLPVSHPQCQADILLITEMHNSNIAQIFNSILALFYELTACVCCIGISNESKAALARLSFCSQVMTNTAAIHCLVIQHNCYNPHLLLSTT